MMTRKYIFEVITVLLAMYCSQLQAGPVSGVDTGGRQLPQQSPGQQQTQRQKDGQDKTTPGEQGESQQPAVITPRLSKKHLGVAQTRNKIDELIAFSQKSAMDIRNGIKAERAKGKRLPAREVNAALAMADRFDRYTHTLQQHKQSLAADGSNSEQTLQTMSDLSQELNLQLQDATQKQQQSIQILSNIMKNQHDTLKSIIQNMR